MRPSYSQPFFVKKKKWRKLMSKKNLWKVLIWKVFISFDTYQNSTQSFMRFKIHK